MNAVDQAAHDAIARAGRPALAWEVLRRDPVYRAAYRSLGSLPLTGGADADFVADWGLHFR